MNNPEFNSSPEYRELEAEVQRRKERGIAGAAPAVITRTPKHIGELIGPALEAMVERHGGKLLTPEEEARDIEERSEAARKALAEKWFNAGWNKICPEAFREPFLMSKLPPAVKRGGVQQVLEWEYGWRGLFIIGPTGHGKTRAVFQMLRRMKEQGRTIGVLDGIQFASACTAAFGNDVSLDRWLREMVSYDILFIDDLAKRFTPATQQGLFAVLDRRTSRRKPVIITINISGDALEQMIAEDQRANLAGPIRRRLRDYCEVAVF